MELSMFVLGLVLVFTIVRIALRKFERLTRRKAKNWVFQIYRDHSGVDIKKVKDFINSDEFNDEEFTHWEMAAIFCTYLRDETVVEVVQRASLYREWGWGGKYNHDFYAELINVAHRGFLHKYIDTPWKILAFGRELARNYNQADWVEVFSNEINEQREKHHKAELDGLKDRLRR